MRQRFDVELTLDELVHCGEVDGLNDLVEQRLTENGQLELLELLEDLEYTMLSVRNGKLVLEVSATVLQMDDAGTED
jgi:hypothetical protein